MTTKHEIEQALAQQADGGVLVELGVGGGEGLRSMWQGTGSGRRLPVYGIDPWTPFRDLLGHEYGQDDRTQAQTALNSIAAHVKLIEQPWQQAVKGWTLPIALLWLDLSLSFPELRDAIDAFDPYIIPGGVVGVTGLEYGAVGTREVADYLDRSGRWQRIMTDQDKVAVFRKTAPRRAVFYTAMGDQGRYTWEAARSAASVKANLGVDTVLFSTESVPGGFDRVLKLPERTSDMWYLDNVRYFNRAVETLAADYGQLLYLDVDTRVCSPCPELWLLLNNFDLALGHSASRDCVDSAVGAPAAFPTFQVGVNLFNVNPRTLALFADWQARYERDAAHYDDNDEAPLRDALWVNAPGVRWMCLAPEYCLRFDFGAWVNGRVRLLHGRVGGRSQPDPAEVDREINGSTKMRLWDHGLVRPK